MADRCHGQWPPSGSPHLQWGFPQLSTARVNLPHVPRCPVCAPWKAKAIKHGPSAARPGCPLPWARRRPADGRPSGGGPPIPHPYHGATAMGHTASTIFALVISGFVWWWACFPSAVPPPVVGSTGGTSTNHHFGTGMIAQPQPRSSTRPSRTGGGNPPASCNCNGRQ